MAYLSSRFHAKEWCEWWCDGQPDPHSCLVTEEELFLATVDFPLSCKFVNYWVLGKEQGGTMPLHCAQRQVQIHSCMHQGTLLYYNPPIWSLRCCLTGIEEKKKKKIKKNKEIIEKKFMLLAWSFSPHVSVTWQCPLGVWWPCFTSNQCPGLIKHTHTEASH